MSSTCHKVGIPPPPCHHPIWWLLLKLKWDPPPLCFKRGQIEKIDTFNQRRIEIAKTYNHAFDKYSNILTPTSDYSGEHVYHLYTLGLPVNIDRSKFISHMKEKGIACGVYYPEPLSELNVFKEAKKTGAMTNCKNASRSVVSIPCEPFMTDKEVDYVISSFLKFLDSRL